MCFLFVSELLAFIVLLNPFTGLVSHFERCFVCWSLCFVLLWEIRPSGGDLSQQTTNNLGLSKRTTMGGVIGKRIRSDLFSLSHSWSLILISDLWQQWREMMGALHTPQAENMERGGGVCQEKFFPGRRTRPQVVATFVLKPLIPRISLEPAGSIEVINFKENPLYWWCISISHPILLSTGWSKDLILNPEARWDFELRSISISISKQDIVSSNYHSNQVE